MAAFIKFTVFAMLFIAMASSRKPGFVDQPPNMPWIPTWTSCDFDYAAVSHAPVCNDCYSTIKCTPVGGIVRNCFGMTPYCVSGKCSQLPSAECEEVETVTDINV